MKKAIQLIKSIGGGHPFVRRMAVVKVLLLITTLLAAGKAKAGGPVVTFQSHNLVSIPWSGGGMRCIKLADMNNDGKLDAVVQGEGGWLYVFLGNGDGTFQTPGHSYQFSTKTGGQNPPSYMLGGGLVVADFNHDGKKDVALADFANGVVDVFLGNGDGTLQPMVSYQPGNTTNSQPLDVVAADFNHDGNLDLAVLNSAEDTLRIFYGDGSGGFPARNLIGPLSGQTDDALTTGDFNGDGWPDLAVAYSDHLMVLTNDTKTGFGGPTSSGILRYPAGIAAGDFGGGHDSFVVAGSAYWYVSFAQIVPNFLYNSSGNIPGYLTDGGVGFPQALTLADMNGDGKLDILVGVQGNGTGGFYILTGNGDGTASPAQFYSANLDYARSWSLDVGDLNGDGLPDVVVADDRSAFEVWLHAPPPSPPAITSSNSVAFALNHTNSFAFTTTGWPPPVLFESGTLPAGVAWNTNGAITGIPTVTGSFPITITATNGVSPNATQNFTLTVLDMRPTVNAPIIYNPKSSTTTFEAFVANQGGSFVTRMGFVYAPTAVNSSPTLGGAGVIEWDYYSSEIGAVETSVNGLTPSTPYSVVAFAVNSFGTNYSAVTTFQTSAGPIGSLLVTTLLDITGTPGVNSLRDAVNYAYQLNDTATVTFDPALFAGGPATFTVSGYNNYIDLSGMGGKLTILGPGPGLLTLNGNHRNEIFHFGGSTVEIDGMTLSNSYGNGGAIDVAGGSSLTVSNVVFINNYSAVFGGAISGFTAMLIMNSTFTSNSAAYEGGAVQAGQQLTIINSTFTGNKVGIDQFGNTNGSGNLGGAIDAASIYNGFLAVNCTFAGNRAYNGDGGALAISGGNNSQSLLMASCTLTGNTADGAGGGVAVGQQMNFPLDFNNTIISGNTAATNNNIDVYSNAVSPYLSSSITTSNCLIDADATAIFGGNTLANNGGPTPTLALSPFGPAINAGNNALLPSGVTTDERGLPRINGGTVDIGAFELQYQYLPPAPVTFNTNGLGWVLNGDTVNGGPKIATNVFTPTDGAGGEDRSAWFSYPLYVGGFHASFTYQDLGGNGADGTAFIIQNDPRGVGSLGTAGGNLGYVGINHSVALMLNLYAGAAGGPSGWLVATNGVGNGGGYSSPAYQSTAPVNLDAGNPVNVDVLYLGGVLNLSFTDTVTSASFQTSVAINIPAYTGTNTCWVGFSGSEAGFLSHQTISNFVYQVFAPPVASGPTTATFVTGLSNAVSFSASGNPAPTFLPGNTLPVGLNLSPAGLLSGTMSDGSGGTYPISIMASNGALPNAALSLALHVVEASALKAHPNFNTNGLGWTLKGDNVNGGPNISGNVFTPTDGTGGETRSAWFDFPLYIGAFQASFTYQDIGGNGADGSAFVIQNAASGTSAVGAGGGGLGYIGITPSVALMLDIYAGAPGGPSGWLVSVDGAGDGGGYSSPDYQSTAPVNLDGGNPINISLRYTGGVLQIAMTDTVTSATFKTNVTINIPSFVGTNVAWVGFTGSEGGVLSHQAVSNFTYAPLPMLAISQAQNGSLTIVWPAAAYGFTLESNTDLNNPAGWTPVSVSITQTNGLSQVVLPQSAGTQFYRLVL